MADRGAPKAQLATDPDVFSDNDMAPEIIETHHSSSTAIVPNQVKLTP